MTFFVLLDVFFFFSFYFPSWFSFANGHRATLFASSTSALVFDLAIVSTVAAFVAGLIAMQVMLRVCSKLIMKHSTKKEVRKRLGTLERTVQKKKSWRWLRKEKTFEDILKMKEGTFQIYLILDESFFGNVKVIRTIGSLKNLDTLSAANSQDPGFLHVHGIAQFRNGQLNEAAASLSSAVALSPNNKGFAEDLAAVQATIADKEVAAANAGN